MKILTSFDTLTTLTASSAASGYAASNVVNLDPGKRWKGSIFASDTDEWLKVDFGAAKSLTALFLNNCNFATCKIQGNASDSWADPSYDEDVTLALDDISNRKGWFDLTAFNYRWLRILIPWQVLDSLGTYPMVGNLIFGTSQSIIVGGWDVQLIKASTVFVSDGGSFSKTPRGIPRHVFIAAMEGTLAEIEALSLAWTMAVIYEDLGTVARSWLVYAPDAPRKKIYSSAY
ncbi:MAG: hypothetical protein HQM10_27190, partial [Candidatus Riflebacteria bacterium]|nr:hypothetical protein [Candidatus Riflebacteria bacterium]